MTPLLSDHAFMGIDTTYLVATGLGFGAEAGDPVILENMACYEAYEPGSDPRLNSHVTTEIFARDPRFDPKSSEVQRISGVTIYPPEYFCAKHTHTGEITVTENTYSIHHFTLSWASDEIRAETKQRWKQFQKKRILASPKRLLRRIIGNRRMDALKQCLRKAAHRS